MQMRHHVDVALGRDGVIRRRDFLKTVGTAGALAQAVSWTDLVSLRASELRRQGKACILLWMGGGPSQFETFTPKPGHKNGGQTRAIDTAVPGIQIAHGFPEMAKAMDHFAIVRSVTTGEGNHQRASFLMHTGYAPTASVKHPTLGALASQQVADVACDLPSFVRIGRRFKNAGAGGFLGVEFDPFVIGEPGRPPANSQLTTPEARYRRRLGLLRELEETYADSGAASLIAEHNKLYDQAARMIQSSQMKAFDLDGEPDTVRDAYRRTPFGSSCLLARRLIEEGVTFVEISSPGNWDTHQDNFNRTDRLAADVDGPTAALVADLGERGMLDDTLVIWMGEFGRTPRIDARVGRGHFPRSFNVALAGGGVRGGQVIGATDDAGEQITDRPVSVHDLFQSFCQSLTVDADHENMTPIGRPIRVVESGEPVAELFG